MNQTLPCGKDVAKSLTAAVAARREGLNWAATEGGLNSAGTKFVDGRICSFDSFDSFECLSIVLPDERIFLERSSCGFYDPSCFLVQLFTSF